MPVQAVFAIMGKTMAMGIIASGEVKAGQQVLVGASRKPVTVEKIEIANKSVPSAKAGQTVGLTLKGADAGAIQPGTIIKNAGK